MLTFFRTRVGITIQLLVLLSSLLTIPTHSAVDWIKLSNGKPCDINPELCGISGMALLETKGGRTEFIVVHDNKRSTEPRLGIVTTTSNSVSYRRLNWTADKPPDNFYDVEAISSVPGRQGQFLALSSAGWLFLLEVSGENAKVLLDNFDLRKFMPPPLPLPKVDIEGLSVQKLGSQIVIVWGHRGGDGKQDEKKPGILYYGLLDLENKQVNKVLKRDIEVKYPSPNDPNTRRIADLKVDVNGVVWASATNDPTGNRGPFVSAIYILGVLRASETSGVQFEENIDKTRLWTFTRKVEAIELVPGPDGGIAFGAEDEGDGGLLYFK